MKRKNFLKLIISIVVALSVMTFVACQGKEETFLSSGDINGLDAVKENKTVYFEWLGEFSNTRPTVVIFHGETSETEKFTVNLDKSAYAEEVTYLSEKINENTIGFRENGLQTTADGEYYDMEKYWTKTAEFNVAIFHAEKFFTESTDDNVTKVYTAYKSRYTEKGERVECNFGYSLSEVVSVLLKEEMADKELGMCEIRFVGYGVGANLTLGITDYLYAHKDMVDLPLPSRITLCDPYITNKDMAFGNVSGTEIGSEHGTAYIMAKQAENLVKEELAIEIVESLEVNGEDVSRAYTDGVTEGENYDCLMKYAASLTLAESYSTCECYAEYKDKKRIAFDWYIYSIIGSDDSTATSSTATTSAKFAVGYPHARSQWTSTSSASLTNWGNSITTRPILNNRRLTNDASSEQGKTYGKNFAIGAWTPTEYIMGLRGVKFVQKEGGNANGDFDIHGNVVYTYTDYVLPTFKSENYQYSTLNDQTILTGLVYLDKDNNAHMDDGKDGMKSVIFVKVTTSDTSNVLVDRVKTTTDKNGRYTIVIKDYDSDHEKVSFEATEYGGIIYGFRAGKTALQIEIELYTPKGYSANVPNVKSSSLYWYETYKKNLAQKGLITQTLDKTNAHSVGVANCLIVKNEE